MKEFKSISKSLIHVYEDWRNGLECGEVLKAKYVDRTWRDEWYTGAAMTLGKYFEQELYRELGFPPEEGKEIYPELYKEARKKVADNPFYEVTVADMLAPYALANRKAKRIAKLMTVSGIKVISVQQWVEYKPKNGRGGHGYLDIVAVYKGRIIVIDVKYSGLLYDKWERMGWLMASVEQRAYHAIQPLHYNMITKKPFFYLVVGSSNLIDVEFFEMNMSKYEKEQHVLKVNHVAESMELLQEIEGFTNYPDYVKCEKCPLQQHKMCPDALRKLLPKQIDVRQ